MGVQVKVPAEFIFPLVTVPPPKESFIVYTGFVSPVTEVVKVTATPALTIAPGEGVDNVTTGLFTVIYCVTFALFPRASTAVTTIE